MRFVAIDLCAVYRPAVGRALPDTVIIVDHFHLVRLANQVVTKVRQRVTRRRVPMILSQIAFARGACGGWAGP